MLRLTVPLALGPALMSAVPAHADTILVPSDQPNLTAAIAVASPGDEIVVQTTLDQNSNGWVTIDKPLIIRGEPVCNIDLLAPGLRLAGPGSGQLTLENVVARYSVNDADGDPSLFGGGFEEVALIDCEIVHDNFAASGLITSSHPAISLTNVERLTLLDCEMEGGKAGADDCVSGVSFYQNGRASILAPDTTVYLLSSSAEGGRGGFFETTNQPCPQDLSTWPGMGGPGVIARAMFVLDSTVAGGEGAEWAAFVSVQCNLGPTVTCGTQPDAPATLLTEGQVGTTAALVRDKSELSLSAGGVQTLSVVGAPSLAGSLYLVLGSLGGSSPGLSLGSFVLPLNTNDVYFDYSLGNPNGAILGSSLGILDAQARGEATVTLSSTLSPALVGMTATHAFVLADLALQVVAVSNAVALDITP